MNGIVFDYSLLEARIVERYGTREAFAKALGVPESILRRWLGNLRYWPHDQMVKAVKLLEIQDAEVGDYFYRRRVP